VDYEVEYDNLKRVPDHPTIMLRWQAAANQTRAEALAELDLPYGPGERQKYDLFKAKSVADAPVIVFIHGGYWQRRDRKEFSFVASAFNANGITVALPSYSLCPSVEVIDIVDEMRMFLKALWQRTRKRPLVAGHSAGGHLSAAMLATNWGRIDGVPADLVRAGYAISGVFDLHPLISTSLNDALKLDGNTARTASPLFWPPPPKDRTFVAAAGSLESGEFLRQSLDMAQAWSCAGIKAECVVVPGRNHFTILDEMTRPESAMLARLVELARTVGS
jgi:arylformamidase